MKRIILSHLVILSLSTAMAAIPEPRTFTSTDGKTLRDRPVKYDFASRIVSFEKNGKIPLSSLCAADQAYILQWNQAEGFLSSMRFKIKLEKKRWARLKHERTVSPSFMDAVGIPGKIAPAHRTVTFNDFTEYDAVYLEARGYEITLHNQNFFPLKDIVVESKVFYKQEQYVVPDDLFRTAERNYDKTSTTNKVQFLSESVPAIVPREKVLLFSNCAIIVDQQVDRSQISGSLSSGTDDAESNIPTPNVFYERNDHSRRRKGRVVGCWVRVGIKDPEGNMVWRETTDPSNLPDKFKWDGTAVK